MSSMVQGDAYSLDVTIKNNGSPINIADVKAVEFTLTRVSRRSFSPA